MGADPGGSADGDDDKLRAGFIKFVDPRSIFTRRYWFFSSYPSSFFSLSPSLGRAYREFERGEREMSRDDRAGERGDWRLGEKRARARTCDWSTAGYRDNHKWPILLHP